MSREPYLVKKDDLRKLSFRCPECRLKVEVMAAPFSPLHAKAKCPHCERVSEVQTRESNWKDIDEAVERQHDKNDHTSRNPVSTSRAAPILAPTAGEIKVFGR